MDLTQAAACVVLAMLAAFDVRARRLPNAAVALFSTLYFLDAVLAGASLATVTAHVVAGAAALVAGALLFHFRCLGGGDAKLAAAVFLWSGPSCAVPVLVVVSVSGTLIASGMIALGLVARRCSPKGFGGRLAWFAPARGVPYGVALAAGGMVAVLLQPPPSVSGLLPLSDRLHPHVPHQTAPAASAAGRGA